MDPAERTARGPGEAFRSGPIQPASGDDALVVHCSDPRYQPHFQQFLNAAFGAGRYGVIAVPGGPHFLTLTEYLPKFSWAGWRWVKFMLDLSHPRRVVLIAHDDCRWYHDGGFLRPGESAAAHQAEDLRRVRAALAERFGHASIELYFAKLQGEEAVFERVI